MTIIYEWSELPHYFLQYAAENGHLEIFKW